MTAPANASSNSISNDDLFLEALAHHYPNADAALVAMAQIDARLTLPKGTVHVVSDVHGEYAKLGHILRNASGSLRPLVEALFARELSKEETLELLTTVYYPREATERRLAKMATDEERSVFFRQMVQRMATVLRALGARYTLVEGARLFPPALAPLFREVVFAGALGRNERYVDALLAPFVESGRALELVRAMARAIRNLSVAELVVAGDLGDRGPRLDKVISTLMQQPHVSIAWGNHDASWMGACLGQPACVATVVRLSLRYGRIAQLEEGFGIPIEPLEQLARKVYGDDPAARFKPKGEDLRDPLLLARMQKAIAIIQFKLEAQTSRRNPHFGLDHRNLLENIDPATAMVTIDGKAYPMLDQALPTVDPSDPHTLTTDETACIERLIASFVASPVLWEQVQFVARRGSMALVRDGHAIFHGCVPVDEAGTPLTFPIDGVERSGRALFDALTEVVHRAVRERRPEDLDLLYWLWAGARSPCFGKDKMATFEQYFVADEATHKETKNPYFTLIHDVGFATRALVEMGHPKIGLIVNGHVPVKLEKGESPLKKSGLAVTIDGAFSEAYGDRGYTLVLDARGAYLALHHHFTSVKDTIEHGTDIVPEVQTLRAYDHVRTVAETGGAEKLLRERGALARLVGAYRGSLIDER